MVLDRVEGIAQSWGEAVKQLGIVAVATMLEDQAAQTAKSMLGTECRLVRFIFKGLPVLLPALPDGQERVEVRAPGEGGEALLLCPVLAGMAITAHAAEYLYFGSDSRFTVAQRVRAYKYLVQAEAMRSVAQLSPGQEGEYEELLGLTW